MAGKSRFDVEHQLYDLLAESNRVPFLFVGSGISQRYMKTEGWEDLLKWVCSSVGNIMRPFYFYKQRASADSQEKNSVYPRMASLMEKDFLEARYRQNSLHGRKRTNDFSNPVSLQESLHC